MLFIRTKLMHRVINVNKSKFSFSVESVVEAVKGHEMWIAEDGTNYWRLIGGTILRCSPVVVHLACMRVVFLWLPLAAIEEWHYIVQPMTERWNLHSHLKWMLPVNVCTRRTPSVHSVCSLEEFIVIVVATRLTGTSDSGKECNLV